MAKRTVEVIDGFSQVQAFKRATAKGTINPPTKPKLVTPVSTTGGVSEAPSASTTPSSGHVGATMSPLRAMPSSTVSAPTATPNSVPLNQIGVTIIPKKRVVSCYSCGYSFTITGKLHVPYCPKCKLLLCVDDIIVDGEQTEDVKTIGDVIIKPTAKLADGLTINGRSVTIGGDVSKCAAVLASEQIYLEQNAVYSPSVLEQTHVVIPAGTELKVANELKCTRLTVMGKIIGTINVSECIEIRAGGHVVGDVNAPSLNMELGAGLTGACKIIKQ